MLLSNLESSQALLQDSINENFEHNSKIIDSDSHSPKPSTTKVNINRSDLGFSHPVSQLMESYTLSFGSNSVLSSSKNV